MGDIPKQKKRRKVKNMWEILTAGQNKERPNYCRLAISIQNYKILTNNKEICKLLKSTKERCKCQPRLPR